MISLVRVKRTEPLLLKDMAIHYSQPKGFVGRNICYSVLCNGVCYGHIVGGSATRFLPGRDEYFGGGFLLNSIVNNIFFHIEPKTGRYPIRNFAQKTLSLFVATIKDDWENKYGDRVIGFESLVELPRSGEVYRRSGWHLVGRTVGYTCKRVSGKSTDSWSGRRVWDTNNLRPKLVFVL